MNEKAELEQIYQELGPVFERLDVLHAQIKRRQKLRPLTAAVNQSIYLREYLAKAIEQIK